MEVINWQDMEGRKIGLKECSSNAFVNSKRRHDRDIEIYKHVLAELWQPLCYKASSGESFWRVIGRYKYPRIGYLSNVSVWMTATSYSLQSLELLLG